MGRTIKVFGGDAERLLSEPPAVGPRSRQPRPNSLGDPCSLELRYGRQDVHLKFPGGRCRVDPLLQADECDA